MEKDYNKKRKSIEITSGRLIFAALVALFSAAGVFALYNLGSLRMEYTTAQSEYRRLREFAPSKKEDSGDTLISMPTNHHLDLRDINHDYVGWLHVGGTRIDYPIVQGSDNQKYLRTTFEGQHNSSGAIFMDSRIASGFNGFTVLYGHNMQNGSMFADLSLFLGSDFRKNHTELLIFPLDGEPLRYRIFDIRHTDVHDRLYTLIGSNSAAIDEYFSRFDIPQGASIVALSTCIHNRQDGRLLVIGIAE